MTNYNERLDEVLERYRLHANMAYSEVEDGFHTADEFNDIALPKVLAEAKQAITSLIKELIEEVIKKPHILPKNAQHLESVKQGINFYRRQMRKRVDKLKEQL